MMEYVSRILVGEMAGADEDFGLEVGQMWLIFFTSQLPTANPTQQDPHGPEDDIFSEPSIILIWTYQDIMEWMSRILV
jgi:hypothetical protein